MEDASSVNLYTNGETHTVTLYILGNTYLEELQWLVETFYALRYPMFLGFTVKELFY